MSALVRAAVVLVGWLLARSPARELYAYFADEDEGFWCD